MYKNVGATIKVCVLVSVFLGFALSAVAALTAIFYGLLSFSILTFLTSIVIAVLVFALGCLLSWLSGLLLYAFGEITEEITAIRKDLNAIASVQTESESKEPTPTVQPSNVAPEWISTIYRLSGAELEVLLREKRDLFTPAELAMIEDALIQRAKEEQKK